MRDKKVNRDKDGKKTFNEIYRLLSSYIIVASYSWILFYSLYDFRCYIVLVQHFSTFWKEDFTNHFVK